MSNPPQPNYASLIAEASAEHDNQMQALRRQKMRGNKNTGQHIAIAACVLATAFSGYQVWSRLAPPGSKQVAKDLEKTVEQARAEIDRAQKETGQFPDTLPAAMASVVRYEKTEKSYKLTATVLGVRVSLESDGPKRTDFGANE